MSTVSRRIDAKLVALLGKEKLPEAYPEVADLVIGHKDEDVFGRALTLGRGELSDEAIAQLAVAKMSHVLVGRDPCHEHRRMFPGYDEGGLTSLGRWLSAQLDGRVDLLFSEARKSRSLVRFGAFLAHAAPAEFRARLDAFRFEEESELVDFLGLRLELEGREMLKTVLEAEARLEDCGAAFALCSMIAENLPDEKAGAAELIGARLSKCRSREHGMVRARMAEWLLENAGAKTLPLLEGYREQHYPLLSRVVNAVAKRLGAAADPFLRRTLLADLDLSTAEGSERAVKFLRDTLKLLSESAGEEISAELAIKYAPHPKILAALKKRAPRTKRNPKAAEAARSAGEGAAQRMRLEGEEEATAANIREWAEDWWHTEGVPALSDKYLALLKSEETWLSSAFFEGFSSAMQERLGKTTAPGSPRR